MSCMHSTFFFLDFAAASAAAAADDDDDDDDDDNDDDDVFNRSAEWEKITKSDRKKIGLVKSDDGEFW